MAFARLPVGFLFYVPATVRETEKENCVIRLHICVLNCNYVAEILFQFEFQFVAASALSFANDPIPQRFNDSNSRFSFSSVHRQFQSIIFNNPFIVIAKSFL